MPGMLRFRLALLAGLLVFCALPGGFAQGRQSRSLVSGKLLKRAELKMLWQQELPIKKTESLERLFILGGRIYALSDLNYMVSLDREDGSVVFSRPIVPPEFVVLGLEHYKDELISIIGNRLVEISPEIGTELRSTRLAFGVTCPAARNSSYFYIAGADRRLRTLRAKDKVKLFEVRTENDSMITSVVADENYVVFATDSGKVIGMAPDSPRQLWQFTAGDGIVGPIVVDGESLFAASKDTYVYKLDVQMGTTPVWKYQTAAVLDKAPRVTAGTVYQYVRDKGLTAIDKESGKFMWQLKGGTDLLAEAAGKAYVITNMGTLAVMDNEKGKQLYSINFAGVSTFATNTADSKIYIADKRGRVECLEPAE